jgi:hypothetical protein
VDEEGSQDVDEQRGSSSRVEVQPLKPRAPVIEVSSSQSAGGKTSLLYFITAYALLPSSHEGKASAAVWIDSDGRFSVTRLIQIMQQLVAKSESMNPAASVIESALNNLYILSSNSASQLLSTLHTLPEALLRNPSTHVLSLLVLDSATAFTAQDRFDTDMARLEAGPDYTSRPQPPTRNTQIITALRQIQQNFDCTIVFSTNAPSSSLLQPASAGTLSSALPTHRPSPTTATAPPPPPRNDPSHSPWTAFALLTLRTSRNLITQFAPTATLEECLRDREKRQVAVKVGRFSVGLEWAGSDRWPPGVREAVEKLEGRGRREMRVTEEGVELV